MKKQKKEDKKNSEEEKESERKIDERYVLFSKRNKLLSEIVENNYRTPMSYLTDACQVLHLDFDDVFEIYRNFYRHYLGRGYLLYGENITDSAKLERVMEEAFISTICKIGAAKIILADELLKRGMG